jgi:uncharacterized protein (TIGR02271 family)
MEVFKMSEKEKKTHIDHEEVTFELHKEEIQVSKKWIETADVTIYKRTYTEEKQIIVPVSHEEIIIEKKILNQKGEKDGQIETTRIPLSEDRIEVILHPTVLEDVQIYKEQFEEIIQVIETVKEEKVHIGTVGDIKVMIDDQLSSMN